MGDIGEQWLVTHHKFQDGCTCLDTHFTGIPAGSHARTPADTGPADGVRAQHEPGEQQLAGASVVRHLPGRLLAARGGNGQARALPGTELVDSTEFTAASGAPGFAIRKDGEVLRGAAAVREAKGARTGQTPANAPTVGREAVRAEGGVRAAGYGWTWCRPAAGRCGSRRCGQLLTVSRPRPAPARAGRGRRTFRRCRRPARVPGTGAATIVVTAPEPQLPFPARQTTRTRPRGTAMPTVPPDEPAPPETAPPPAAAAGRLSAGEAAVIVAAISAVTVLTVLERPVPAVLTAIASAAVLLLLPHRAHQQLTRAGR